MAKWVYKSFSGAVKLLSILCLHFQNSPWQLMAAFSCFLWISIHFLGLLCQLYKIRKNRFLAFLFSVMPTMPLVTFIHLLICPKAWSGHIAQKEMVFLIATRFPLLNSDHISGYVLSSLTSLLDIWESSWHNWACPVRKSTWRIPLKQRDALLNWQSVPL